MLVSKEHVDEVLEKLQKEHESAAFPPVEKVFDRTDRKQTHDANRCLLESTIALTKSKTVEACRQAVAALPAMDLDKDTQN
jgi:hypothetical protein